MNINNWSDKEIVKLLIARTNLTQRQLSLEVSKILKKEFSSASLTNKLSRNTLKVSELQAICEILGYNLLLEKKEESNQK